MAVHILIIDHALVDLEDSQAQLRKCSQRLLARAVWKAGQAATITTPEQVGEFPNLKNIALHRPSWNILVCRDVVAPPEVRPRSNRPGWETGDWSFSMAKLS